MFTRQEFELAYLNTKRVTVAYSADPTAKPTRYFDDALRVEPGNTNSIGYQIFLRQWFGDRLRVTLGPVVSSHNPPRRHQRMLHKGRSSVFDLRGTDGSIEIAPGECLTVSTLEEFQLGPDVAATLLPRLTLATAGISVLPSYIDPLWHGILQLEVINHSSKSYRLQVGEAIAICRFHAIAGKNQADVSAADFAKKSHHYGMTWAKILNSDVEPQPLRKQPEAPPVKATASSSTRRLTAV